jgi:bacillithiol system protein YtxJ
LNWIPITSSQDADKVFASKELIAIFKHSTRCAISSMAKNRLDGSWDKEMDSVPIYYLDLIKYKDLSKLIAEKTGVEHESPQLILIKNGEVLYSASHNSINTTEAAKYN